MRRPILFALVGAVRAAADVDHAALHADPVVLAENGANGELVVDQPPTKMNQGDVLVPELQQPETSSALLAEAPTAEASKSSAAEDSDTRTAVTEGEDQQPQSQTQKIKQIEAEEKADRSVIAADLKKIAKDEEIARIAELQDAELKAAQNGTAVDPSFIVPLPEEGSTLYYTRWLWWLLIAYMFYAQATVCDDWFVPAIEVYFGVIFFVTLLKVDDSVLSLRWFVDLRAQSAPTRPSLVPSIIPYIRDPPCACRKQHYRWSSGQERERNYCEYSTPTTREDIIFHGKIL